MSDELKYLSKYVANGKITRRYFMGRAAALGIAVPIAKTMLDHAARAQGPIKGGTFGCGIVGGGTTDSLDPALVSSSAFQIILRLYGDTLLNIEADGSLAPRLAEEYSSSKDAKTWAFKIRKDVQFHNGKTLTPNDVLQTMLRHSDEKAKSAALGLMGGIDTMKVDGDNFIVNLKEANADLPYLLSDYHLVIQPNGGRDNPADGIGTGPYTIEVNEPGVRQVCKRFENHWDETRGHVDQVEVFLINDATARIAALQSGKVHMINRVEPKIVDNVKRIPNVTIKNVAGRGHYCFPMHCNTQPFDNNDLRLALKLAMNREEMVDKILRGYGSIGNDTPINAAYSFYTEIPQRPYDPEKAAFHYKKSGHSGPIVLRVAENAFPGAIDAAQLYQEFATKAGINITIRREPSDGYWEDVWNKLPFCASYWIGRPTQDIMFSTAYVSTAEWNESRFFNDRFDALITQARAELNPNKRREIYNEAGLIVHNEGGEIIPMFNDFIDAIRDDVQGYVSNPNSELMNSEALTRCWLKA